MPASTTPNHGRVVRSSASKSTSAPSEISGGLGNGQDPRELGRLTLVVDAHAHRQRAVVVDRVDDLLARLRDGHALTEEATARVRGARRGERGDDEHRASPPRPPSRAASPPRPPPRGVLVEHAHLVARAGASAPTCEPEREQRHERGAHAARGRPRARAAAAASSTADDERARARVRLDALGRRGVEPGHGRVGARDPAAAARAVLAIAPARALGAQRERLAARQLEALSSVLEEVLGVALRDEACDVNVAGVAEAVVEHELRIDRHLLRAHRRVEAAEVRPLLQPGLCARAWLSNRRFDRGHEPCRIEGRGLTTAPEPREAVEVARGDLPFRRLDEAQDEPREEAVVRIAARDQPEHDLLGAARHREIVDRRQRHAQARRRPREVRDEGLAAEIIGGVRDPLVVRDRAAPQRAGERRLDARVVASGRACAREEERGDRQIGLGRDRGEPDRKTRRQCAEAQRDGLDLLHRRVVAEAQRDEPLAGHHVGVEERNRRGREIVAVRDEPLVDLRRARAADHDGLERSERALGVDRRTGRPCVPERDAPIHDGPRTRVGRWRELTGRWRATRALDSTIDALKARPRRDLERVEQRGRSERERRRLRDREDPGELGRLTLVVDAHAHRQRAVVLDGVDDLLAALHDGHGLTEEATTRVRRGR
jgi:hypothetical protein